MQQSTGELTFFQSVLTSLENAAAYNSDDTIGPTAVIWPDEKREWEKLVPRLQKALPQFLTFGSFDPDTGTGPAIWLRCVLGGMIPEVSIPQGTVPILYLPRVSRATLRATEDCPSELKPLAELQYRGVFWSQINHKDWTVAAFLQAEKGGLQLNLARDQATTISLRRALEKLADAPLADLRAKSSTGDLNSSYFDSLVSDDLVDDLLSWMADPKGSRGKWEPGRWETLCSRCIADYGLDPARDGELTAGEHLGTQLKPVWKNAWKRYAVAPSRYAGIESLLRKAKPSLKGGLFSGAEPYWPQDNEAEEESLRKQLLELPSLPVAGARQRLIELEVKHGERRDWVWAKLNHSPLACAVSSLATLAAVTAMPLTGAAMADMVSAYTGWGWKADAAVLDALAAVSRTTDQDAVGGAVAHVYAPWLRDAAELFQARAKASPLPGRERLRLDPLTAGTCVLFADGLRYDVGQKFLARLAGRVGEVRTSHQFVALPSVTPTSKPAVSPVAAKIKGSEAGLEFRPCLASDGKDLTPDRFRKLLADDGVQYLGHHETGDPTGMAWTEFGNLDSTGHAEGQG